MFHLTTVAFLVRPGRSLPELRLFLPATALVLEKPTSRRTRSLAITFLTLRLESHGVTLSFSPCQL